MNKNNKQNESRRTQPIDKSNPLYPFFNGAIPQPKPENIIIEDQNELEGFEITVDGRFGFWSVVSGPDSTPIPEELSGKYTSWYEIKKAITHYLETHEVSG